MIPKFVEVDLDVRGIDLSFDKQYIALINNRCCTGKFEMRPGHIENDFGRGGVQMLKFFVCDNGMKYRILEIERLWEVINDNTSLPDFVDQVPFVINGQDCGWGTSKISLDNLSWRGYLTVHLPVDENGFIKSHLLNKSLFGSKLTTTWGTLFRECRFKCFSICADTKTDAINGIDDMIKRVVKELSVPTVEYFPFTIHRTEMIHAGLPHIPERDLQIGVYSVETCPGKNYWATIIRLYIPSGSDGRLKLPVNGYGNTRLFNEYLSRIWGTYAPPNPNILDGKTSSNYRFAVFTGKSPEETEQLALEYIRSERTALLPLFSQPSYTYYILNGDAHYTVRYEYSNKKPGYKQVELYLPTDATAGIRKDIMDFNKTIFGERLYVDWGWIVPDQKFRSRKFELPVHCDFMKEIELLTKKGE